MEALPALVFLVALVAFETLSRWRWDRVAMRVDPSHTPDLSADRCALCGAAGNGLALPCLRRMT